MYRALLTYLYRHVRAVAQNLRYNRSMPTYFRLTRYGAAKLRGVDVVLMQSRKSATSSGRVRIAITADNYGRKEVDEQNTQVVQLSQLSDVLWFRARY